MKILEEIMSYKSTNIHDVEKKLFFALRQLRIYYFSKEAPDTLALLEGGVIDFIFHLCEPHYESYDSIQLECLWILTNTLTGDSEESELLIYKKKIHQIFIRCMFSLGSKIREQVEKRKDL